MYSLRLKELKKTVKNRLWKQIIGISGLFFISIVSVIEANFAFKKASNKTKAEKEKIISSEKKGWFK